MKSVVSFLLLCISISSFSQELTLADTLDVELKKELTELYTSRVEKQQAIFDKQISNRRTRREVQAVYEEMSDAFINTIEEGYFVENEVYRDFLDDVLEKIQKSNLDYPAIKDTKILLSHGALPNAYAIGNDMVVLYMALVKSIPNEYELAFIICHEIAHNLLEHSYNDIVEHASLKTSKKIRKKTREVRWSRYNRGQQALGLYKDIVYGKRKNNRKLEHQADSLGFILYENAFPDKKYQAIKSLQTLGSIDVEREMLSYSDYKMLFDTEKHSFKKEWINNEELSQYNYDTTQRFWQVDSLKTHPDCDLRIASLEQHFNTSSSDTVIPSEVFTVIQKASHANQVLGLYAIEEYGRSLYEALLLLKNNPSDSLLNQIVTQNLIKLQKAQRNYVLNRYLALPSPRYSNSYNAFLYSFRQVRNAQLNAIINKYNTTDS